MMLRMTGTFSLLPTQCVSIYILLYFILICNSKRVVDVSTKCNLHLYMAFGLSVN